MNKKLLNYMKEALNAFNYIYNRCVDHANDKNKVSLKILRDLLINEDTKDNQYFSKVPYDIKSEAIRDFIKAYKLQCALVKSKVKKKFLMKHKRKKECRTFVINSKHIKVKEKDNNKIFIPFPKLWENNFFRTYKKNIPLKTINKTLKKSTKTIECFSHDVRIEISITNKVYLILSIDKEVKTIKNRKNVCSLDPGVKIFQTIYDNNGKGIFIGENDIEKIYTLGKIAERMRNGIKRNFLNNDKTKRSYYDINKLIKPKEVKETSVDKELKNKFLKIKRKLRMCAYRIERRIRNLIKDLHCKLAKYLCSNYDNIIIPQFQVKNMTIKEKRNIGKKTVKSMLHWSHFNFRQLLIAKGEELDCNVIVGTEEYTSKTCGNCFYVNMNLSKERILSCLNCKSKIHRDLNGSRNILILNSSKIRVNE